jgi:hypothetical protein
MRPATGAANTRLNDAQCNRLREDATANGLLTRRAAAGTPRK